MVDLRTSCPEGWVDETPRRILRGAEIRFDGIQLAEGGVYDPRRLILGDAEHPRKYSGASDAVCGRNCLADIHAEVHVIADHVLQGGIDFVPLDVGYFFRLDSSFSFFLTLLAVSMAGVSPKYCNLEI